MEAVVSFLVVTVFCCSLFALVSPKAKKKLGVWLIAHGEAQEEARLFFVRRRATLTAALIGEQVRSRRD